MGVDGDGTEESLLTRQKVFRYFGTFSRSAVSLTELTFGNFVPIARLVMEDCGEGTVLIIIMYKLCIGFGVMSIIRGIFMQEVFKVASSNDHIMVLQKEKQINAHKKKMNALFEASDASGDGTVGWDEFQVIL